MAAKKTTVVPHSFVLEELSDLEPLTKPMFGCLAIYVNGLIVLILRERDSSPRDNGVWLATTEEHHASLQLDFPSMRSIEIFGGDVTGWQNLPLDAEDFEEAALKACELVRRGDPRIGKVPPARKRRAAPLTQSKARSTKAKPPSAKRKTSRTQPSKPSHKKQKAPKVSRASGGSKVSAAKSKPAKSRSKSRSR